MAYNAEFLMFTAFDNIQVSSDTELTKWEIETKCSEGVDNLAIVTKDSKELLGFRECPPHVYLTYTLHINFWTLLYN